MIFFELLHSGSAPELTNPEFTLGLAHPHQIPDQYFWNKLTPPIENEEDVDAFLNNF